MRTTVTLDPDTHEILRQRMLRTGASFKRALNDAIREGGATRHAAARPFRTPTFSLGEPLVDLDRAGTLAADLEDEALVAKMSRGA